MSLNCIDKILSIEKGKRIVAQKVVRPDEEYFKDHFVGFPVLPGVLMLEGLVQAASWYVQATEGFRNSQVFMSSCQQVKYSRLVRPGAVLTFECEFMALAGSDYDFKGKVTEDGRTVAGARFRVRSNRVGDSVPLFASLEDAITERNKRLLDEFVGKAAAGKEDSISHPS